MPLLGFILFSAVITYLHCSGHVHAAKYLVEYGGADPNQQAVTALEQNRLAPLMVAVLASQFNVVEYLLSLPEVTEAVSQQQARFAR